MADTPVDTPGIAPNQPTFGGIVAFAHVLVNTVFTNLATSFLWWALTFWIYEQTRSVLATGIVGGSYMLFTAVFSLMFGTLVDNVRKKTIMVFATTFAFVLFAADALFFFSLGEEAFVDLSLPWFWFFAVVMLAGAVVEQLRNITLSTTVTLLVPPERRANANGMVGTAQGVSFLATGVFSGISVGFLGMGTTMLIGIGVLGLTLVHLAIIRIPEPKVVRAEGQTKFIDVVTGYRTVRTAQGLMTLIALSAVNNLAGGVFMALMDPYGIDMFGVEMWGIWLALGGTGFIIGGLIVAKTGLGKNPVRTMLIIIAIMGFIGATFAIREWAWLYVLGIWLYMTIVPAIEAAEQTLIQTVTPYEKQGRVFGFAMTVETAAAPVASFAVAPLAEFFIIPYVDSEAGRNSLGWLLGEGQSRGIALTFLVTGVFTILLAVFARTLPAYHLISDGFARAMALAKERGGSAAESNVDVLPGVVDAAAPGSGADGRDSTR